MKRLIAMFLSTVLIMMMSAFAFAYVDEGEYKVVIESPEDELTLLNEDDKFFVTGYIMANDDDIIEWIKLSINGFDMEIMDVDPDFDDVIGDWEDEKFAFKFVVSPEDFNINDVDGDYNIAVSTQIEPDDENLGDQTESDSEWVEFNFGIETDYEIRLTKPINDIVVDSWSDDHLIKGWIQADEGDMLELLRIEIEDLDRDTTEWITIIDDADDYLMMSNDKFNFEEEWDLTKEGEFKITLHAVIDPDEGGVDLQLTDSFVIEVTMDEDDDNDDDNDDDEDEAMDNYPAAPAVANMILKDMNKPNRYMGTNLISEVAKMMGPNTEFEGISKMDATKYEEAIRDFLEDRIGELDDMDAPPAPGNSANKGNGKVKNK